MAGREIENTSEHPRLAEASRDFSQMWSIANRQEISWKEGFEKLGETYPEYYYTAREIYEMKAVVEVSKAYYFGNKSITRQVEDKVAGPFFDLKDSRARFFLTDALRARSVMSDEGNMAAGYVLLEEARFMIQELGGTYLHEIADIALEEVMARALTGYLRLRAFAPSPPPPGTN